MLYAEVTKDGVVFGIETEDGERTELAPIRMAGYRQFSQAIDVLDDAVVEKAIGERIILVSDQN